jgi:hypothetical protein
MQVGFELEEIQVTPSSIDCIMNMTFRIAAYWAKEPATTLKINAEV